MKPQFLNSESGNQLLCVHHQARGRERSAPRAVVICPPIGQEFVRTHWCLRLVAAQMARRGIHVLRFDYSGIGDSGQTLKDIRKREVWRYDVQSAAKWICQVSGASSAMLLGLRMGATLAVQAAQRMSSVNSLLLWEPVHCGQRYLTQMRMMHQQMLKMWICRMVTENSDHAEEILGSMYAKSLVQDMEEARIDWGDLVLPHFVFDTHFNQDSYQLAANSMRKIEFTHDDNSWSDLKQLETAWLRPETSRKVVDRAVDTFDRLDRFGVLKSEIPVPG